jgi:cell division transport system ATP-binding protein
MAATERHVRRRERSHPHPAPAAPARSPVPGAVIDFANVAKRYPSGDVGLDGVSFAVQPGEFVFLVGASGSGKSTTIRLLIKETEPTGGTIHVAGHNLAEIPRKRVPYYRRNIGVVFQDYKLLPNRTVYENVAYALQVTGGEQQRVSVARAFVNHPPLLLADEPTGNLDPETSIGIMQLLYRINRTGTTVVVATHDVDMVNKMRRRVIELSKGRVMRDERAGAYAASESTQEFELRMREDDT